MTLTAEQAEEVSKTIMGIRNGIFADPSGAAEKMFGYKFWPRQAEMFDSVWKNNLVCYGTGHKVGKTDMLCCLPVMWLLSHWPGFVLIIAADYRALISKVMATIRARVRAVENYLVSEHGSRFWLEDNVPQRDSWTLGDRWKLVLLSPDTPESVQGYHSEGSQGGSLFIVEEASHLRQEIHDSLMSYADDPRNCVLYLGNPLKQDEPFAEILRQERPETKRWHVGNISSWETPNSVATLEAIKRGELTEADCWNGKEVVKKAGLATWSFCQRYASEHGEHSSQYQVRVLGIVPSQAEETYIGRDAIVEATNRPIPKDAQNPVMICVDPAWSEVGDETGILAYDPTHDCIRNVKKIRGLKPMDLARHLKRLALPDQWGAFKIRVEVDGMGIGPFDILRDHQQQHTDRWDDQAYRNNRDLWLWPTPPDQMPELEGCFMAEQWHDKKNYASKKSECWAYMKRGLRTLAIPPSLAQDFYEIATVKYEPDDAGRLKIEPKKDYRKRTQRSPAIADCTALIYARPVGDPVFYQIDSQKVLIQMRVEPSVYARPSLEAEWDKHERLGKRWGWWLHLKGYPQIHDQPGVMHRAWFLDRRGTSVVLLVHQDNRYCFTVVKALSYFRVEAHKIAQDVFFESRDREALPMRFSVDVASAREASYGQGYRTGFIDEISRSLYDLSKRHKSPPGAPSAVPIGEIKGVKGLDTIDRWISNNNPANRRGEDMLCVWPPELTKALSEARLKQPGRMGLEMDAKPEEAIGGGGPYVMALRLLALEIGMERIAAA